LEKGCQRNTQVCNNQLEFHSQEKQHFFGSVNESLCNKRPIADGCLKCLVLLYGNVSTGAFCKEQFAS